VTIVLVSIFVLVAIAFVVLDVRILRSGTGASTALLQLTYRRARRIVILVIGCTLLLIGALALVLPVAPGIPLVLAALTLLATEFLWARTLLRRAKEGSASLYRAARRLMAD
jgi:tellurite resistance protein TerC